MKQYSYDSLKKEEQELEQLKGKVYSLEGQACEIMKEILKEIDKKKQKPKKPKKVTNSAD